MGKIDDRLEALFDKVRALPEAEQIEIANWLTHLTAAPYRLSRDELDLLLPELEGAKRGEFASAAEVDAVLHQPWAKASRS